MSDPKKRFESYVEHAENGCWMWKSRGRGSHEYGSFSLNGGSIGAHRASWLLYRGQIPSGMQVCHSCDSPGCVNPGHLFLGSHTDNLTDMTRKGRRFKKLTDEQIASVRAIASPLPNELAKLIAAELSVNWHYLYHLRKAA